MNDTVIHINRWPAIIIASLIVHILLFSSVKKISEAKRMRMQARAPVAITVSTPPKPKTLDATPIPTAQPTAKPTVRPTAVPQKQVINNAPTKPKEEPQKIPEVHGLSANSFAPEGTSSTTIAVAGNSLMVEDTGLRKAPEEIIPLPQTEAPADLSQTAHLDLSTLIRPEYTKEAIKVRLKGDFPVDVHVAESGEVLEVEFSRNVGFGMEERIKQALLKARFFPERDQTGKAKETWVTVQFRLEMP